jgi:PAS domain-containing protein
MTLGEQIRSRRSATSPHLLKIAPTCARLPDSARRALAALDVASPGGLVMSPVSPSSSPLGCKGMSGHARLRSSALSGYGFALLLFALAFACVAVLGHVLQAAPPVSLFLCAIIVAAWFAGLGPALLVCALSVLAFGYFYLLPLNSLTLASRDLPRIVLFGIASLVIAAVSAAQRKTAASLGRARDALQDAVSELETVNAELRRENAEREAAEVALRRSEAYLDHAQQLSRTGSFARDIATGDLVWSKEIYRMLGIEPSVKPSLDLVMAHVPPEERDGVRKQLGRPVQGAQCLDVEHRWLMSDGSTRQLHIRSHRVIFSNTYHAVCSRAPKRRGCSRRVSTQGHVQICFVAESARSPGPYSTSRFCGDARWKDADGPRCEVPGFMGEFVATRNALSTGALRAWPRRRGASIDNPLSHSGRSCS